MPSSPSGTYSLTPLRFQNTDRGDSGVTLHGVLQDMGAGIRTTRQHSGGGGGGSGSISVGQIASFTACVGDVLATAITAGDGLTISAGTHTVELKISAVATSMIPSFTACVQDAAFAGLTAGNGVTISANGHLREIKTATITAGQILSFTAAVGQAANVGLAAGTAIVLSFNATTNVTEIRASITSGGGISSFTACVGDAMFPNLKAGTNVAYSFNAGTHQTEINVTGSLGAISSLTTSVQQITSLQTRVRYVDDYGAVGGGISHPISESFSTTASALVFYPYMTSLSDEKDYSAMLTALYGAPGGTFDPDDMVHVHLSNKEYYWGTHTFTPQRCIHLYGVGTMEGNMGSYIVREPGGHGIVINNTSSAGSLFEGFELNHSGGWHGGVLREYNPGTGLLLLTTNDTATTLTSSLTIEVRPLLSLSETVTGKFYYTGPVNPYGEGRETIEINIDPIAFTLGETVTWTGGSGVVAWTGYRVRGMGISAKVGANPAAGMTITGGTSGASAIITQFVGVRVAITRNISVLSGTVDGDTIGYDDDAYEHFVRKGQFGHGFLINRRCYLNQMKVNKVTANGVYIAAGGGGYSGNANLTRLHRVLCSNSAGNGVSIQGADANVITVSEGTYTENSGYGVMDNSFLGAIVYGNHISGGAIGSFYFGGGNSISFGNYTEGNQDRLPHKRKISRVTSGHLDMCGTTGTPTIVYSGGCRLTNASYESSWFNYPGDNTGVEIRDTGSSDGGAAVGGVACLRINNGGNRGSGLGVGMEMGIPWDLTTHNNYSYELSYPAMRMTAQENGGLGRTEIRFMTLRQIGPHAIRARNGGSFKGNIKVAGAGTITSVSVLVTGAKNCTLTDTLSISNPGAGAGAVLVPIIRRGQIEEVYVQSGGSGYAPTFSLQTTVSMRDDFFALWSWVSGQPAQIISVGVDADTPLKLAPQGAGTVMLPHVRLAGVCNITTSTSLTASADLILSPAGNGKVRFGTFTTTAVALVISGYIEITDSGGTLRRLAVVA